MGKGLVNLVTLRGIIVPVDWDEKGNEIGFAISTQDENEYRIREDDKGKELKAFIREEVAVTGELTEEGEKKIISVKDYRL